MKTILWNLQQLEVTDEQAKLLVDNKVIYLCDDEYCQGNFYHPEDGWDTEDALERIEKFLSCTFSFFVENYLRNEGLDTQMHKELFIQVFTDGFKHGVIAQRNGWGNLANS